MFNILVCRNILLHRVVCCTSRRAPNIQEYLCILHTIHSTALFWVPVIEMFSAQPSDCWAQSTYLVWAVGWGQFYSSRSVGYNIVRLYDQFVPSNALGEYSDGCEILSLFPDRGDMIPCRLRLQWSIWSKWVKPQNRSADIKKIDYSFT